MRPLLPRKKQESLSEPDPGPRNSRPSLRAALVLRTLLPLFIVLGAATALTLVTLEREVQDRMEEDVELVARGLQLPLTHALEEDRWEAVSQALQSALEIRRFYGAHVYGPEGERLASFGAGLPDEPPERLAELAEAGDRVGEYGHAAGRRVYSYFVPLVDGWGQTFGVLQITRRRRDIDESIQRLRLQAGGFFLLAMGLVTVLVVKGHHRAVGGPLDRIRASMARVRSGDRSHRATPTGPREMAEVAETFNSMLEAMDQAQAELESRRRSQEDLRRNLAEAEKLAAVGELAGGVAHELGSPLSVIDGKAQRLLRTQSLPEETRTSLERVRKEVRRMEGIVRQLLDFGRRETGRNESVPLRRVVRGAVATAAEEAKKHGVTLESKGPGDGTPPAVVDGDPRRLEHAVANLVRNACQAASASASRGRVRVRWAAGGDGRARITVEDDGPGVDPEIASRIFEPFFTTKATGEGTGLGLAVVHGVVDGLGGSVEVDRSPLGGARFRLFLPLADGPPRATSSNPAPSPDDAREEPRV